MRPGPRLIVVGLVAVVALISAACSEEPSGSAGAGWRRIAPHQLSDVLDAQDVVLVNVHVPFEGDIPGTDASIPYTELAARVEELPDDPERLVIYCRSGSMSTAAAEDLVDAGYTGFAELDGGFASWQAAGFPLQT